MWRFLSSSFYRLPALVWSSARSNISDYTAATCAHGPSNPEGVSAFNVLLSVSASDDRPPDPACAHGIWRAPWWTAPSQDRSATRTLSPLELSTPAQLRRATAWMVRDEQHL